MTSLPSLLPEGATPREIFQPNDLCSRCNENEVEFIETFNIKVTSLPDKTTQLGFCSQECYAAFCGGIDGARTMQF